MATDETRRVARRALLTGAAGGLAAVALNGVARPETTRATHAGAVQLGHVNSTDSSTTVGNTAGGIIRQAILGGVDGGVVGQQVMNNGVGVRGNTTDTGGRGVLGNTSGHHSQVAVDGDARSGNGEGIAVRARTGSGIAVLAEAPGGVALQAFGRTIFNRSGKITIPSGQSAVTVGHVVTAATIVVATIQGNVPGRYVRGVSVSDAADNFTIRLNKPAPPGGVVVGYFLVN